METYLWYGLYGLAVLAATIGVFVLLERNRSRANAGLTPEELKRKKALEDSVDNLCLAADCAAWQGRGVQRDAARAFVARDPGRTVGPQRFGVGLLPVAKADWPLRSQSRRHMGRVSRSSDHTRRLSTLV